MKRLNLSVKRLLLASAIVIGLGIGVTAAYIQSRPANQQVGKTSSHVTVRGQLVCLPHRNTSGPQTDECAYGLKITGGTYYGLRDSSASYAHLMGAPMNKTVEIEGTLQRGENTKYKSSGTLTIDSLEVVGE